MCGCDLLERIVCGCCVGRVCGGCMTCIVTVVGSE